jgi:hypothetical protein
MCFFFSLRKPTLSTIFPLSNRQQLFRATCHTTTQSENRFHKISYFPQLCFIIPCLCCLATPQPFGILSVSQHIQPRFRFSNLSVYIAYTRPGLFPPSFVPPPVLFYYFIWPNPWPLVPLISMSRFRVSVVFASQFIFQVLPPILFIQVESAMECSQSLWLKGCIRFIMNLSPPIYGLRFIQQRPCGKTYNATDALD